jgi:hypothetical protein
MSAGNTGSEEQIRLAQAVLAETSRLGFGPAEKLWTKGLETLEERAENNSPTRSVHGRKMKKKPGQIILSCRVAFLISCLAVHLAFLIELDYCLAGCTVPSPFNVFEARYIPFIPLSGPVEAG